MARIVDGDLLRFWGSPRWDDNCMAHVKISQPIAASPGTRPAESECRFLSEEVACQLCASSGQARWKRSTLEVRNSLPNQREQFFGGQSASGVGPFQQADQKQIAFAVLKRLDASLTFLHWRCRVRCGLAIAMHQPLHP